jgi:TPR repeat protein/AcrR family transcriptional regulator
MRTNAEGFPGADGNGARVWQRDATRRSILDAARMIVAREGVEAFSLNTVAKETGLSVAKIFAYYAAKNDVFSAIVTDDLVNFARALNGKYMFLPKPDSRPSWKAETSSPVAKKPVAPITPTAVPAVTAPPFDAEISPKIPEQIHVDARIERCLHIFEKSLADMEARLSTLQLDKASEKTSADESIKTFAARLDASEKRTSEISKDLTTRMAASETRLRDVSADLRARLLNAGTRIDVLEEAAHRFSNGGSAARTAVEQPADTVDPPPSPIQGEQKEAPSPAEAYIAAARKVADTAAVLTEIDKPRIKRKKNLGFGKRSVTIVSLFVLVLFTTGASFAFAVGYRTGLSTPVQMIAPRTAAVAHPSPRTALVLTAKTPLDKLWQLANAGKPAAEFLIGLKYYCGDGVGVNLPEAAKWIGRAANANDAMAQFWMGKIYSRGDGVSADAAQALHWYETAAAQGNRQAMHDVGMSYAQGLGTQKDYVQAAKWFEKAAELGLVNSQFNLAVLYERGEGVPQNLEEAYKWYAIAAQSGDSESKTRVDALATAMSPSVLDRAKAAADAFKPMALNRDANVAPQTTVPSRG